MGVAVGPAHPVVDFSCHPLRLISEEQVVAPLEACLPVGPIGLGRIEPHPGGLLVGGLLTGGVLGFQERFPGIMLAAVHEMPIIQPRPTKGFLRHIEGDGVDDMEPAAGRGGGATYVARVVGYFGTQKYDMKRGVRHETDSVTSPVRPSGRFIWTSGPAGELRQKGYSVDLT